MLSLLTRVSTTAPAPNLDQPQPEAQPGLDADAGPVLSCVVMSSQPEAQPGPDLTTPTLTLTP